MVFAVVAITMAKCDWYAKVQFQTFCCCCLLFHFCAAAGALRLLLRVLYFYEFMRVPTDMQCNAMCIVEAS